MLYLSSCVEIWVAVARGVSQLPPPPPLAADGKVWPLGCVSLHPWINKSPMTTAVDSVIRMVGGSRPYLHYTLHRGGRGRGNFQGERARRGGSDLTRPVLAVSRMDGPRNKMACNAQTSTSNSANSESMYERDVRRRGAEGGR